MGEFDVAPQAPGNLIVSEDWHLHYDYGAGPVVSHFLRGLADGRIQGRRCNVCEMVWVPPRGYCERCFVATSEWVDVGPGGSIEAATIVTAKFDNLPDPPYVVAFCRLDGASTAIVNFLEMPLTDIAAAARQLRKGARVRTRFKDEREQRMSDFRFELAENSD